MTAKTSVGYIRTPMLDSEVVGDRLVPSVIEVELPGADGQPRLEMVIELIDGIPRCTELLMRRNEGGREIRPKDLRLIDLEGWIEAFVSHVSSQILEQEDGAVSAVLRSDEQTLRAGMKTIRDARKRSRRPMTEARRQQVADVYNAQQVGGIEAVETAFQVSRSTAVRYINAARAAGLIQGKKR